MGRHASTAILGMGIVAMVFMTVMSAVYLGRIPGKAEVDALQRELEATHSMYLSPTHAFEARLTRTEEEGGDAELGIAISCALRPDLTKDERIVTHHLRSIAVAVFEHPDWQGVLDFVTVSHVGLNPRSKTFPAPKPAPKDAPAG